MIDVAFTIVLMNEFAGIPVPEIDCPTFRVAELDTQTVSEVAVVEQVREVTESAAENTSCI